jgi:hypothetical protein
VPNNLVTLAFASWEAIAESAGLSRQWGGIHAASAHTGGQAAAVSVHASIQAALHLTPT